MVFGKPIHQGTTAKRRAAKHRRLKRDERATMAQVRDRERHVCRFPHTCGLTIEVSHSRHRGMGGNPSGDRTTTASMVGVCGPIHRTGHYALDKKNLQWRELTAAGADGPIAWDVRSRGEWIELARESAVGVLEPLTARQLDLLRDFASVA